MTTTQPYRVKYLAVDDGEYRVSDPKNPQRFCTFLGCAAPLSEMACCGTCGTVPVQDEEGGWDCWLYHHACDVTGTRDKHCWSNPLPELVCSRCLEKGAAP